MSVSQECRHSLIFASNYDPKITLYPPANQPPACILIALCVCVIWLHYACDMFRPCVWNAFDGALRLSDSVFSLTLASSVLVFGISMGETCCSPGAFLQRLNGCVCVCVWMFSRLWNRSTPTTYFLSFSLTACFELELQGIFYGMRNFHWWNGTLLSALPAFNSHLLQKHAVLDWFYMI